MENDRFQLGQLAKSFVLMGRKTWESIPESKRPLPNRQNIVISSNSSYSVPENVLLFTSVQQAVQSLEGDIFIAGGSGIYKEALEGAKKGLWDCVVLGTLVRGKMEFDTFMPEFQSSAVRNISCNVSSELLKKGIKQTWTINEATLNENGFEYFFNLYDDASLE